MSVDQQKRLHYKEYEFLKNILFAYQITHITCLLHQTHVSQKHIFIDNHIALR